LGLQTTTTAESQSAVYAGAAVNHNWLPVLAECWLPVQRQHRFANRPSIAPSVLAQLWLPVVIQRCTSIAASALFVSVFDTVLYNCQFAVVLNMVSLLLTSGTLESCVGTKCCPHPQQCPRMFPPSPHIVSSLSHSRNIHPMPDDKCPHPCTDLRPTSSI